MAERLETVNFTGAGRCKYPWDEWTDGNGWVIWRGTREQFTKGNADYHISTVHMQIALHQRARKHQQVAQTESVRDGAREGLKFQFTSLIPKERNDNGTTGS